MALRNKNAELREGATDGKYKKLRPNLSNESPGNRTANLRDRAGLFPWTGFSIVEDPEMVLPDGTRK